MNEANPIDLLFGGMEKLGPGSNSDTLKVLSRSDRQELPFSPRPSHPTAPSRDQASLRRIEPLRMMAFFRSNGELLQIVLLGLFRPFHSKLSCHPA